MKPLTAAQWHTLALLADGHTTEQAAQARRTTDRTIRRHRDHAIRNLDATTLEQALRRFQKIRKHNPPPAEPAKRPVDLDSGGRYYVTTLTGWPDNHDQRRNRHGITGPKIYHVHDRDYNSRIVATYDEQLKNPETRRSRALKTARELNANEDAAA